MRAKRCSGLSALSARSASSRMSLSRQARHWWSEKRPYQAQVSPRVAVIATDVISEAVTANRADPRQWVGTAGEPPARANGLDEDFLRQLFRQGLVTAAGEQVSVHPRESVVVPEAE